MGEIRKPVEVLLRKQGKKVQKIELFPIHLWQSHWEPLAGLFSPKVPLRIGPRTAYWHTRYRVRLDGVWYSKGARFTALTRVEVIARFLLCQK